MPHLTDFNKERRLGLFHGDLTVFLVENTSRCNMIYLSSFWWVRGDSFPDMLYFRKVCISTISSSSLLFPYFTDRFLYSRAKFKVISHFCAGYNVFCKSDLAGSYHCVTLSIMMLCCNVSFWCCYPTELNIVCICHFSRFIVSLSSPLLSLVHFPGVERGQILPVAVPNAVLKILFNEGSFTGLSLGRSNRLLGDDLRLLDAMTQASQIQVKSKDWAMSVLILSAAQQGLRMSNGFSRVRTIASSLQDSLMVYIRTLRHGYLAD